MAWAPSPDGLRRFHFIRGCVYLVLWVTATVLGWVTFTWFVSHVSMLALVEAAFIGWTASRAEVQAEKS